MDLSDVVKENKLGSGGQGTVWAVKGRKINGTWPVAYKEYNSASRQVLKSHALEAMVEFLPRQDFGHGQWLSQRTAWPAQTVTDGQRVCGFLMRRIPPEFCREFPFAPGEPKVAGFQFLLNNDQYLVGHAGLTVTPRQRFQLLLDFAKTMDRLHRCGIVMGDVSPNNVLFSLGPEPSCFFIDCDAMSMKGQWALPSVETPGWALPTGERPGSTAGDAYKFGLLAVRLFAGQQEGEDVSVLRTANKAVGALAERSLATSPARRPSLEEWLGPLEAAVLAAPTVLRSPRPRRAQPVSAGHAAAMPSPAPPTFVPPAPARPAPGAGQAGGKKKGHALRWLVGLAAAWILIPKLVGLGHSEGTGTGTAGTDGTGTSSSAQPSGADAREAQAQQLAALLERNKGTRVGVQGAVDSLQRCSGLSSARTTFVSAARNRDELVNSLGDLALDRMPDELKERLLTGWKSSADADRAYARVVDEVAAGCTSQAVADSSAWEDAAAASGTATKAKQRFVELWNPVAADHGQATVSWDEL